MCAACASGVDHPPLQPLPREAEEMADRVAVIHAGEILIVEEKTSLDAQSSAAAS